MDISTVGIVGAGLMGAGIAEVSARNGLRTIVTEANADLLAAGQLRVDNQHVVASHHRDRARHDAPRSGGRHAFLQSASGDEAPRGGAQHRDE